MNLYTIYPDYTYDIDNYDHPYSAKFSTLLQPLSLNNSNWWSQTIKQSTFVNDDFFLYSDPHKTILSLSDVMTTLTYPIIQGQLGTYNNIHNPLTVNFFLSSYNAHYISRTYQKLQNALANCSGIASALFIIGRILTEIHFRMKLLMIIIKNLYVFKTKTNKSENQVRKRKKIKKMEEYELKSTTINAQLTLKNIDKKFIIKNQEYETKESDNINFNRNQKNILMDTIQDVEVHTNLEEKHIKNEFLLGNLGENKIKQKILSDMDNPQPEMDNIIIPMSSSITKGPETKITGYNSIVMPNSIKIQESKINDDNDKIKHFEEYLKKHLEKTDNKNYNINISNLIIAKGKRLLRKNLTYEEQLILKAEQVFNKEVDIVSILRKLQEIEKIKFVLLNPSQISLLKLLEKPVINCDEDNPNLMMQLSTTIIESGNIISLKKKNPLVDIYKQLLKSESKSEVDCRILQLLDDGMKLDSD